MRATKWVALGAIVASLVLALSCDDELGVLPITLSSDCNACHVGVNAPTSGNHSTHTVVMGYACTKCHDGYWNDPAHNNGVAETGVGLVAFDATNAGAAYDGTTCSNTWCHGPSSLNVATSPPDWGASPMGCGECHTVPMDGTLTTGGITHTTHANCYGCHADVVNPDNTTFADESRHVDGIVDISTPVCGACHSPPVSSGSHTAHVATLGYACARCHNGYFSNSNHINGSSETTGTVAFDADNPAGTYNEGASSCGSTWCHGPNSASADPIWGGATPSCGQCHPNPPTVGSHVVHTGNDFSDPSAPEYNFACSECHKGAGDGTALHVNFTVDVVLDPFASSLATGYGANGGNIPTWNAGPNTCTNVYCHSNGVTKEKGGAYDSADIGSPPDGVLSYNTPVWGGSVSCGDCHAGAVLGTTLQRFVHYPDTGAHRTARHTSSPFNRPVTGYVPCSSCHSTAVGDALQGTYGSAEHVDGALKFHPYAVPSGGTIQNPEGTAGSYQDGHCGDAAGCWY